MVFAQCSCHLSVGWARYDVQNMCAVQEATNCLLKYLYMHVALGSLFVSCSRFLCSTTVLKGSISIQRDSHATSSTEVLPVAQTTE